MITSFPSVHLRKPTLISRVAERAPGTIAPWDAKRWYIARAFSVRAHSWIN